MKKTLKIILIVTAVLVIAAGSFAIWQWESIEGVIIGINEDAAEIKKRRDENQTKLVEDVNSYLDEPVRELTEEEKQKIEDGEVTINDVYMQIFQEKEDKEKSADTVESKAPLKENVAASAASKDEIISRYMAQMYGLQSEFTARAEATISQGARYYESIKSHPQDAAARASTITKFTPVVRSIEAECDGKVEAVLVNLKNELEAIGTETDIIGTIKATYQREKQLKLSYYANKYLT